MKCPSPIAGMVWPARPLDDYLGELRAHGYTVVDGLIVMQRSSASKRQRRSKLPNWNPHRQRSMTGLVCPTASLGARMFATRLRILLHCGSCALISAHQTFDFVISRR